VGPLVRETQERHSNLMETKKKLTEN